MDLPQKSGIEVKSAFDSKTVKKGNQLFILFDSIIVTKCKKLFKGQNPFPPSVRYDPFSASGFPVMPARPHRRDKLPLRFVY